MYVRPPGPRPPGGHPEDGQAGPQGGPLLPAHRGRVLLSGVPPPPSDQSRRSNGVLAPTGIRRFFFSSLPSPLLILFFQDFYFFAGFLFLDTNLQRLNYSCSFSNPTLSPFVVFCFCRLDHIPAAKMPFGNKKNPNPGRTEL